MRQNGPSRAAAVSVAPFCAVVQQADEGREADGVGEQDAFVVGVVGRLPDAVQEVDAEFELVLGQPHLSGEGVHVAHERRHDLSQAAAGRSGHGVEHDLGDRTLIFDDVGA